jgi:hypothetical protein
MLEWFELDPASRKAIFHAEGKSRSNEGSTADKTVATYVIYYSYVVKTKHLYFLSGSGVHSKPCNATKADGEQCTGVPIMVKFNMVCWRLL